MNGNGPATVRSSMAFAFALGLACVALVGCQGNSPSPSTTTPQAATPGVTQDATSVATPASTPASTPSVPAAPAAQIIFNEMELDAAGDPMAQSRTFTFVSDGPGAVSVAVIKSKNPSDKTHLCVSVDSGAATCFSDKMPSLTVQAKQAHSSCSVQVISADKATTPIVDVAISWPANHPEIKLEHGRLQGSSSPGIDEELNGFNVTFQPRSAGTLGVSAKWTTILTYIDVVLFDATALPWVNVDEKQYQGGGSGVGSLSPAYAHAVDLSKTYRFSLRDTQADNYRPDLTAVISFP